MCTPLSYSERLLAYRILLAGVRALWGGEFSTSICLVFYPIRRLLLERPAHTLEPRVVATLVWLLCYMGAGLPFMEHHCTGRAANRKNPRCYSLASAPPDKRCSTEQGQSSPAGNQLHDLDGERTFPKFTQTKNGHYVHVHVKGGIPYCFDLQQYVCVPGPTAFNPRS